MSVATPDKLYTNDNVQILADILIVNKRYNYGLNNTNQFQDIFVGKSFMNVILLCPNILIPDCKLYIFLFSLQTLRDHLSGNEKRPSYNSKTFIA